MELFQVRGGSVFEHAITLERGLTIMKSLCHLPTRHIALFQYSQLLCPPHPHPKCVVLPQEDSSASQEGSKKFFSLALCQRWEGVALLALITYG